MGSNKPIWVTGFMSGTSLDGVDAACLLTDGVDISKFGPSAYRPYSCLLYTSPSPRDVEESRMPSSA